MSKVEALEYLQNNKVIPLFELLGAKLAVAKPADPNEFLVAELTKLSALASRGQPITLFTEKDVTAMFAIFDITGRGTINQSQYLKAINAVGFAEPALPMPTEEFIDKKTFVKHINAEVMNRSL